MTFKSLGVVVIDEQHRFGVEQRATLRSKGEEGDPDLLVMTATPIPRTAAMVIFGDLDLTVLDELPPGRTQITTEWLPNPADEHQAWDRVRDEVAQGHRAFVVCPLVGESARVEARSAVEECDRLRAGELAGLSVGLLHGQMTPALREETMARFRAGEVQVLVATTVIEVGIDVPEATVMVIESAERFGIAQLHQLRGRVGRGDAASWCYLLGAGSGESVELADERLAAVARTTDGFLLAEEDLKLRGEGTILGVRQKGQSDLRLASLSDAGDRLLLTEARRVAEAMVNADAQLQEQPLLGRRGEALFVGGRGRVPVQELGRLQAVRVIGGRSRGRRLAAKLPLTVRPTSDRVRESIFDILGSQGGVDGLSVVDLFCGSGAHGARGAVPRRRLGHLRRSGPGRHSGRAHQSRVGRPGRRPNHHCAGRPARMAGHRAVL